MLQKHKPLLVLAAAAVWLALKTINLTNGTKMDSYCRDYSVGGRMVRDCVACLKFDQSAEWHEIKDMKISVVGDEVAGHKNDEFLGIVVQQNQCVQYECSSLLLEEDLWFEK